jgi:hypothetical protein
MRLENISLGRAPCPQRRYIAAFECCLPRGILGLYRKYVLLRLLQRAVKNSETSRGYRDVVRPAAVTERIGLATGPR